MSLETKKGELCTASDFVIENADEISFIWSKPGGVILEGQQAIFLWLSNEEAVDKTTALCLEDDGSCELEPELLAFSRLEVLDVRGSRWVDLTCKYIPASVKILSLHDQSNLPPTFVFGMERLENLERLCVDRDFLIDEAEDLLPLPRLPMLWTVELVISSWISDETHDDIHAAVLTSRFFLHYDVVLQDMRHFEPDGKSCLSLPILVSLCT